MTAFEISSSLISIIALILSIFTAYKTLSARFDVNIFLRSRVVLTKTDLVPSIVVGLEITNTGGKAGSVEDVVLLIKYKQSNNNSMNRYSFLPVLMKEDFNVLKTYQSIDFEAFDTIVIPGNSRFTRYVVFIPSSNGFVPFAGDMELEVYFRISGEDKWRTVIGTTSFPISEDAMNTWKDDQGRSIMTGALSNNEYRDKLMKDVF